MDKYSTLPPGWQEGKIGDGEKAVKVLVNTRTGEYVQPLDDKKFDWRAKKRRAVKIADLYTGSKHAKRGRKLDGCATYLEYMATLAGDKRQLLRFNACHQRLCPTCSARRARIMSVRLGRVLDRVEADHDSLQYIFLTLTVRNVPGDQLIAALDQIAAGWWRLIRLRRFERAVKGWFRAIEITWNEDTDEYHPHIHAILCVENAYFADNSPLWINHDDVIHVVKGNKKAAREKLVKGWVTMWRESLRVDYDPSVWITATYAGRGSRRLKAKKPKEAVKEAAKYAVKDAEFLKPGIPDDVARKVLVTYTDALIRRRMNAMGGWIKDAAAALDVDLEQDPTDLTHDETEAGDLTLKTAQVLEAYSWRRGLGVHVLDRRWVNPDYVKTEGDDDG